jgi:hypothetical protein
MFNREMKETAPKKSPLNPPKGGLSVPNTLKTFIFFEERNNTFPFAIRNLELGFTLLSFYLFFKN